MAVGREDRSHRLLKAGKIQRTCHADGLYTPTATSRVAVVRSESTKNSGTYQLGYALVTRG